MSPSTQIDDGESFGRYRLIERLGAGGMAVVYRAIAQNAAASPSPVVIKRVLPELSRDPAFVKMLVAEARLSSRLNHPGIVQTFELGRVRDEYFLAMEYVDGFDLVRMLNRCAASRTPVPIGVASFIAQKIAAALGYAHALKDAEGRALEIVHRDVSPANIMVTVEGEVKLLDFGVAKAAEHVHDDRTRTGMLKGKINYLSPEQAEGLAIDGRSDLFALGIVLHEMLTLKRLFRGPSDLVTLRLVRQCEVVPPSHLRPGVPPELDTIVLRMLARDRGQRFASGDEIAAALGPVVEINGGSGEAVAEFVGRMRPLSAPAASNDSGAETAIEIEFGEPLTPSLERLDVRPSQSPPPSEPVAEPPHASHRFRPIGLWSGGALLLVAAAVTVAGLRSHRTLSIAPAVLSHAVAAPLAPPPASTIAPAPSRPARLTIELDANARIFLDGVLLARSSKHVGAMIERPGEHVLRVTAPHRRPYVRTILVEPGLDLDFHISLARPASNFDKAKVRTADGDYLVDPFPKR
jgi:serine/threonine protein kinase